MSDIAIRAQNLGKLYRIGKPERYRTLRDTIADSLCSPFRRLQTLWQPSTPSNHEPANNHIWALKDVSFEINRGDVVGIIGRNGAGKTTLLKILSRITEPTTGQAHIRGRVGSLLEVGTGFHPELTGRENIYLNAAILGMKKADIARKFDEIVAFAEVEKFLDTPVKHYSSGMYVRLAFAVAAHLDPDILLVDEVLAVGDAAFQKKCLGKMGDVSQEGRTVLFVSHNLEAVLHLCSPCFVLDGGLIAFAGNSEDAVGFYLGSLSNYQSLSDAHVLYEKRPREESNGFEILKIEILDDSGHPKAFIRTWDNIILRVYYSSSQDFHKGSIILEIRDSKQQRLMVFDSGSKVPIKKGAYSVDCFIPKLSLASGEYYFGAGLAISNFSWVWRQTNLSRIHIQGKDVFNLGRPPTTARMLVAAHHEWLQPVAKGEVSHG